MSGGKSMEITRKDLVVLSLFRQDARRRLTTLSKETGIPVSTLFDKMTAFDGNVVHKTTSLLNFNQMGFEAHANVLLRAGKNREQLKMHLMDSLFVNSLYKVNNGFDYLAECVFRTMGDLERFLDVLRERFDVQSQAHYVVDDLKREAFLADPSFVDKLVREPRIKTHI